VSGIAVFPREECRKFGLETREQCEQLRRGVDDDVREADQLARRLVRGDGDANAHVEPVERAEAVGVGRVVAGVERAPQAGLVEHLLHGSALVRVHGRTDLEHLAAEARDEPGTAGLLRDLFQVLERGRLVFGLPVVERNREPLVLDGPVDCRRERVDLVPPAVGVGSQLEAVRADVTHSGDADESPRVLSCASADAGDQGVPVREPGNLSAGLVRHPRVLGPRNDRGQRPVDIEEDRGALRRLGKSFDRRHGSYDTDVRFIAIGLAAGFFSALFGVGGGIVVVPLLILAAGFGQRTAAATSLASIGLIAFAGTVSYALRGDVDFAYGLLLGLPAAVGAIGGTELQQRVGGPALSYAFAGLLAAVGVWLLI
jgi:uncharacterized protein